MRILFLHDRLTAKGGADRYLVGLMEEMRISGYETLLAAGLEDKSLSARQLRAIGPWQKIKGLKSSGLKDRGVQAAKRGLLDCIASFRPDVIHVHNLMHPALLGLAADQGNAVMTVQDHRLFCPGQGKLRPDGGICGRVMGEVCMSCLGQGDYAHLMLGLTRERLRAAAKMTRVHVLSNYMAKELARAWRAGGVSPPKVRVVPPFVHRISMQEPASAQYGGEGGYHLLACRLVERKGVLVAIQAAAMMHSPTPLVIAGDGVLADLVSQAAAQSQGRIQYMSWAGREKMSRLLGGAKSLWLPSLWAEPFGIVGLEAMSLGTPVIASRVGGIANWLDHNENGILVRPGEAGELAQAAERICKEAGLARRLGENGRELVRKDYAVSRIMGKMHEIYRRIGKG
jgi:glycosyltransferase involved in cell wall biosynthesis